MPSPKDARKAGAKPTPEKTIEFGPKLSSKRSQDFASKIQGWNERGGGIVSKEGGKAVSLEKQKSKAKLAEPKDKDAPDDVVEVIIQEEPRKEEKKTEDRGAKAIPATPPKTPKASPNAGNTKKPTRDVDLERRAWVRRKSKPQVEIAPVPDLKHAGTPKKRVVSDGHWRRDRKDQSTAMEKEQSPKPVIIKRSVVSVGLRVPPSSIQYVESEPEPPRTRPLRKPRRSRSTSRSDDEREATPNYESRGTKVFVTKRRPTRPLDTDFRKKHDQRSSESSFTAPSSMDKTSSSTEITTPSLSLAEATKLHSGERNSLKQSRSREHTASPRTPKRSPTAEDDGRHASSGRRRPRSPIYKDEDDRSGTPKVTDSRAHKLPVSVKRSPSPVAAPIAPKIYGNRIEGWLADTSDPFTDRREDASLTPEPLSIPKKKSQKDISAGVQRGDIAYHPKEGRTRHSPPVLERLRTDESTEQSLDEHSDDPPSTLKRSGARRTSRSPVKDRVVRGDGHKDGFPAASGAFPYTPLAEQKPRQERSVSARNLARPFPSTGKQLSTIASIDTYPTRTYIQTPTSDRETSREPSGHYQESLLSRASDGDIPERDGSRLKRRTTKHSDLISVLSVSREDGNGIPSSRSLRASRRQKTQVASIGELMNEISRDELRYQRELRTLVDGVIPVLLQHALSGNESAKKSNVFSRPTTDADVTKPIVAMGVALERLKTLHRRVPMHEPEQLLTWAESAAKAYTEYLVSWRMGYKDIIVNLAPAEQTAQRKDSPGWEESMPRNKEGDLVDADGERVDVAHLLKRPLVRLKSFAKAFRDFYRLQPSATSDSVANTYQKLVGDAKEKVNDEHARLEDEAAACIDASRSRDSRSLAPITGVSIDPTRHVRARDYFDMDLVHSSGQQLCCKIEIIYRDDAPHRGKAGDVLFCEVSTSGRWLLFPPLPPNLVTARKGDKACEIVVMIRGFLSNAQQWREIMSLQADDEQAADDWLQMLGSSPLPPAKITRKSSFNMLKETTTARAVERSTSEQLPQKNLEPSSREVQVPLGEQVKFASRIWDGSEVNSVSGRTISTAQQREKANQYRSTPSTPLSNYQSSILESELSSQPDYFYEQPRNQRYYANISRRPVSSHTRSHSEWTSSSATSRGQQYSVWMPPSEKSDESDAADDDDRPEPQYGSRPGMHRRTSSVPSHDIPKIPKSRRAAEPVTPRKTSAETREDYYHNDDVHAPTSAPAKLQKRKSTSPKEDKQSQTQIRPTSLGFKSGLLPSLTPAFMKKDRRPSSPLKHEYAPSSPSDSYSDSEMSDLDDIASVTSESTVEQEAVSTLGDLKAFHAYSSRPVFQPHIIKPEHQMSGESVGPSESASQAPYRAVPPPTVAPEKVVASIFSWSERGSWDSLHPEECCVFVTPGLIEAFDITQAHSALPNGQNAEAATPSSRGVKPLVALELTPLVPLRRGTALDISIRSPASDNSLIRTGSNVMFRSRSAEECEKLYALINRARIDNPTYIALQNARGPMQQSNWAEVMDRRNAARTSSGSWWNLGSRKSTTYRSTGSRPASIAATESSVGTMNTAFSALRRFSGSNRIWNIAKSTITSKEGTRSSNSESLSSGVATPVPLDPRLGTPLGITNAKIRLYVRESAAKWRDMGSARLTVMLPPRQDPTVAANPKSTGLEKRILIYGKSQGETLLDATLGESCFERVARTGIAVSVWEENMGPNGEPGHVHAIGGVLSARTRTFMVQMKSERDAAYTFGLVGKLRY